VTVGLAFNAIWLRTMYASLPRMLLFYAGCVAAMTLSGPSQEVVGIAISLLITLGVGRVLALTLRREQVLRAATERLLDASDEAAIRAIGDEAKRELGDHEALDELAHQATHDVLTGLANRVLLSRRLEEAAAPAVVFIDLDDFKTVNDRLGHAAGDALLVAAGRRIAGAVREGDTVARLGGDEFAIVVADRADADAVAARVAERLAEPFSLNGHELVQTASIGIADEAPDPERLLRHADISMYTAKARGKGRSARFDGAISL
jgi:diguanylate cyclase (GGDEF)-like protein